MINKMYAVYDSKAEVYTFPFYVQREAEAIRMFSFWINDKEHKFGMNPEDYTLFDIGEYETTLGIITQDKINAIGNGLKFIKNEDKS